MIDMKWWEKPSTPEDIRLWASHRLMNDAEMTVYTMKLCRNGHWIEDRHFVNPHLAHKRMVLGITKNMTQIRDSIQSQLFPATEHAAKAFEKFGETLKQMQL